MSGTIVIGPTKSMDVRTVGFLRLVEALRSMRGRSQTATKLLESVDEYGMNMICADGLDPAELRKFDLLVEEIGSMAPVDDTGLVQYLNNVRSLIISDGRYSQARWCRRTR